MGGMQGSPNAVQMAQMLLANFDQNGNGALEQAELEQALLALMQRMQQFLRHGLTTGFSSIEL